MTRADDRRARTLAKQTEFDAMLAAYDLAMTQADNLDQLAKDNNNLERAAVQASRSVGKRLEALAIMERYHALKIGPVN